MTDEIRCANGVHIAPVIQSSPGVVSHWACDCRRVLVDYDGRVMTFRAPADSAPPAEDDPNA